MIRVRRGVLSQGVRRIAAPLVAFVLLATSGSAQTRFSYSSGQPLEPAYEGWMQNQDGSYTLYFGYQNTNWEQEFDVLVGPENSFRNSDPPRQRCCRLAISGSPHSCRTHHFAEG